MGRAYQSDKRSKNALEHFNRGLAIWRDIGYRVHEARALCQIGRVYEYMGHLGDALKYYKQSLAIEAEIGSKRDEEITLRAMARLKKKMDEKKK